ncbi:ADK-domain-containing protein [Tilletiaria anomala UBC 951]|uniref:GTP:AMP phosphotransferase, mitochondrial n=1 Tax=Tilletiaria anomala (strain ATCC 24038 / CBS 436.72 / UBC 951) TaxID=1037660 RepID=A0A066VVB4_TILAU|nr:ADK-domain-containing protein [Tilletiaria anomala UBC 951]KDN42744.1 ADK-domain-containing protein [Tilletiaria anomala UBC 951]
MSPSFSTSLSTSRLWALRSPAPRFCYGLNTSIARCTVRSSDAHLLSRGARGFATGTQHEAPTQMRMLIVGCPGSGKGTLSSRLLKKFDVQYLSAGDVLRSHISRNTEIGKQASVVIAKGSLMPDDIMMKLVGSEVDALADTDWLLDGFPRTLGQAKMLDEVLQRRYKPLNLVVNLDVPEGIILQRIMDRWTHIPSGRIYNLSYNPPQVPGKDDVTGEPLEKRPDDNPHVFAKRLTSFHSSTGPMLEYYRDRPTTGAGQAQALYVNLEGSTSDELWPKLADVLEQRFPSLMHKTIAQ